MSEQTNTEYLRDRLLTQAGLAEIKPARYAHMSYEDIQSQECDDGFADLMDNRLIMGFLRYGPRDAVDWPALSDYHKALDRLEQYRQTGNLEYLVDAANFCRLEFGRSKHRHSHFHAVDRSD